MAGALICAAEPFTSVLVLPAGSTSYMRITLPAATQLITVKALTSSLATTVTLGLTIAVSNGTRTSRTSQLSLLFVAN
jgi:hypothetical protein